MKYRVRVKTFNEVGYPENLLGGWAGGDRISLISNMQNRTCIAHSWGEMWFDVYYTEERTIAIPVECLDIIEVLDEVEESTILRHPVMFESINYGKPVGERMLSVGYSRPVSIGSQMVRIGMADSSRAAHLRSISAEDPVVTWEVIPPQDEES